MVFESFLIDAGVAFLIVVALAQIIKIKDKASRGFMWLAIAGISIVFAGFIGSNDVVNSLNWMPSQLLTVISDIFLVIGAIVALVGTLFVGYELLTEK